MFGKLIKKYTVSYIYELCMLNNNKDMSICIAIKPNIYYEISLLLMNVTFACNISKWRIFRVL